MTFKLQMLYIFDVKCDTDTICAYNCGEICTVVDCCVAPVSWSACLHSFFSVRSAT